MKTVIDKVLINNKWEYPTTFHCENEKEYKYIKKIIKIVGKKFGAKLHTKEQLNERF